MSDNIYLSCGESPDGEESRDDSKPKGKPAERQVKRTGKRGRKPAKIDVKAKLERSRQSARECRARKKLRYQYLEELAASRERAIFSLREELEQVKKWCCELDKGNPPKHLVEYLGRRKKKDSTSSFHSDPSQMSPVSMSP